MLRVWFDVETSGLLHAEKNKPAADKIHSLVIKNADTGTVWSCHDHGGRYSIQDGLHILGGADWVAGHNIITFDLPVLKKLKGFTLKPGCVVFDTLVCSRLIWTDLKDRDFTLYKRGNIPAHLIGRHSLEAWGYRLGILKGEFGKTTDWKEWSPAMQTYCEQDVTVEEHLGALIDKHNYSAQAIELEHAFQEIIFQQEEFGFPFNEREAAELQAKLVKRRDELTHELRGIFPPKFLEMKTPAYWDVHGKQFPTKAAASDYASQADIRQSVIRKGPNRQKQIDFNPGSRDHIAERLKERGWVPTKFTDSGKPQVDESVLDAISIEELKPTAKLLNEYLLVSKRLGQLAEGDEALLKLSKNGRIHGRVITCGCATYRCSHMKPNVAQTPAVESPYGGEFRACYTTDPGHVLVGTDMSGCQARCLAHFMAKYDGGEYAKVILEGDVHSTNQQAAGIKTRSAAKTWFYAYLFGAGDELLGNNAGIEPEDIELAKKHPHRRVVVKRLEKMGRPLDDRAIAAFVKGSILRRRFETNLPALGQLVADVKYAVKEKGCLRGIDGRLIRTTSSHSALNYLLQCAEAVLMKHATVSLKRKLDAMGLTFGVEYAFLASIHDEFQIQARPELAETVGNLAVQSIRDAGVHFKFRLPIDGQFRIGRNWKETH